MVAHVLKLPLSLHALVAEAKRRARRRRVLLAVAVIALGGGAGAVVATHPFGWLESSQATADYQPGSIVYCGGCLLSAVDAPTVTVATSSAGSAWIVGEDLAWRWDGKSWRNVPGPHVSGYPPSVFVVGRDDVWAVGAFSPAAAEHWNGIRWTSVPLPDSLTWPSVRLSSVSASGPRDVWAAGLSSPVKRGRHFYDKAQPLLLHWNGVAWRRQQLPWAAAGMGIDKVVATGPSSVWVVPSVHRDAWPPIAPPLEHWDGSSWSAVPRPFGAHDPVAGFSATSGSDAWAVGSYRTGTGSFLTHPLAAHWDGSSWKLTAVPHPEGHNVLLVGAVSVRPDDVWAIGLNQQTAPDTAFGPRLFFVHWDGRSWTVAPGSASSYFSASPTIAASPDGTAWATTNCGNDNVVLRWDGARWRAVPHPRDARWDPQFPASVRRREGPIKSCAPVSG
ncbi:MAG: hypothetical protein QOG85_1439 [Gaiellaceae bacterium]|jgi:hypothetical protein|nr:hypothetical protein [Gaiellaceae bacterium]